MARESISLRLEADLLRWIDHIAARERRSRSETIRLMLEDMVEARQMGMSVDALRETETVRRLAAVLVARLPLIFDELVHEAMAEEVVHKFDGLAERLEEIATELHGKDTEHDDS